MDFIRVPKTSPFQMRNQKFNPKSPTSVKMFALVSSDCENTEHPVPSRINRHFFSIFSLFVRVSSKFAFSCAGSAISFSAVSMTTNRCLKISRISLSLSSFSQAGLARRLACGGQRRPVQSRAGHHPHPKARLAPLRTPPPVPPLLHRPTGLLRQR